MEHKISLTSSHEPESYVRTTATNGDHDATAETLTVATATTAPGADDTDDGPDDEHKYVNKETDNNVEPKKSHSYDIDKQCSGQHLNAINVGTKSIPNTRFRNQQKKIKKTKQSISILFNYSKIVLTLDVINMWNCGLNFCILLIKMDKPQILVDYKRYERYMIWTEFLDGKETTDTKQIFSK